MAAIPRSGVRLETTDRDRWLAAAGLALIAAAHLLIPGLLLRAARLGYGLVLDVAFEPREGARRRVRLLGIGFGLAAVIAAASEKSTTPSYFASPDEVAR